MKAEIERILGGKVGRGRETEHGPRHGHGAEGAVFWGVQGRIPWWGLGGETPGKFSGLECNFLNF